MRVRRRISVVLLLSLLWGQTVAQAAGLGVGIYLSDTELPDLGERSAAVVGTRIAARTVCSFGGNSSELLPPLGTIRSFLLQLPDAATEECWIARLPVLAGTWSGAQSTYLLGESPHLSLPSEPYAYLLKRAAVALRAGDPNARVFVGPMSADGATWLQQVLTPETLPYADGIACTPEALPAIAEVRDRTSPGLPLWSIESGEADAGFGAASRAARALALGAQVSLVHTSGRSERQALSRVADLLQDDFQTMHTSRVDGADRGEAPLVELIGGSMGDVRILLFPPHARLTVGLGPPAAGRAEIVDLESDVRTDVPVRGRSGRQRVTLEPATSLTAMMLFGKSDQAQEPIQVTSKVSLTAAEIIAREQESQARQRLELGTFEGSARIEYHFSVSNLNESIDVVTQNDAFSRNDAIEYRQRSFHLNGHLWKGKPPSLPFIAPERVKEVPLRIALDEGYRYKLQGIDSQAGRECYRIAFEPLAPDSADFRGTVWIDRRAFFRVRMDLARLHPPPPASSDVMTQWFEPRLSDSGEYWLMTRTVGQMQLSAVGRSVVLDREVEFTDFVINPGEFDEHRREAHASDDLMFRDSLDEGLVALRPGASGDERISYSATTKSNTMLVGGFSGSTDGGVPAPFAGVNWFDLDFRGTGVQVDLAWGGPFAILSLNWPVPDSRWQVSLDSAFSAISVKDRHSDLTGRVAEEDLRRQEQLMQASFRRTLSPFFSISIQPSLGYLRMTNNDTTGPDFLLPPDTLTAGLGVRLEYQRRGYELGLWARGTHRDSWDAFGLPGNASRLEVRENPVHYGLQFSKSFHGRRMDRFSLDLGLWGGQDLDRFSAFRTRVFPGLRIRGYDGKGLQSTQGITGDFRYALPPLGKVRFELAAGGAIFDNPEYYGEESQYAYGASLAATFPGLWGTFLQVRTKYGIDSSLPVEGSQGSIRLTVFKTFDGWWPWTRSARKGESR